MAKWADFVVSAIQRGSGLANISHVQIHEDLEHGFGPPQVIDKYQLSSKIQRGISFITVFKKNENEWTPGEIIRTYVKDGEAHIRTDDNKVDGDNIGPLPAIDEIEIVFTEIEKEEPKVIPTPPPSVPQPEPVHEPEPEPVSESPSTPTADTNSGDYEYEDSRREILAKSAEAARSEKSLPKGWSNESDETKEKEKKPKISRREEFSEYEKKYLEEIEKTNAQNKKLKEELRQAEEALHEARIARRLELEKASGKNYEELLPDTELRQDQIEPNIQSQKSISEPEESQIENKRSIESRISGMFKRTTSEKDDSSKIADDTRNFIRKRRVAPEPEPTPQTESNTLPEVTPVDEDKKRELLAQEAQQSRSQKSMPKDWSPEKAHAEEEARLAKIEREKAAEEEKAQKLRLEQELAQAKADQEEAQRKEKEQHEKEIAEIKAQAIAEAKREAEAEAQIIREKLQQEIDAANAAKEQLQKEVEEIRLEKEKLELLEKEKAAAEAKAAQEQLQRELEEAKAAKEQLEREENAPTNSIDLATEIQNELNELRAQLANTDEDEPVDESSQNELIISVLKTAVDEGWTKTKTVQEIRKSTGITVKKAREYASEVFG